MNENNITIPPSATAGGGEAMTGPGGTLEGLEALQWLESNGARFCKVYAWNAKVNSPGKQPIEDGWQNKPLTVAQITPHLENGGNVGVLCGAHSGNIGMLDIDEEYDIFSKMYPHYADFPTIVREDAPDKAKIPVVVDGPMPKSKKWKHPGENSPYLEWLSDGNQGVAAGTHKSGAKIKLKNANQPILKITLQELDDITAAWTGEGVLETEPAAPSKPVYTAAPPPPEHKNGDGLRDAVLAHWDPLKVFQHFGKATETRLEKRGTELRLMHNGGLFVHVDNGAYTCWNLVGERGIGGGTFEAWQYCKNGNSKTPKGRQFAELLHEMAQAAGIAPQPEPAQPGGDWSADSADYDPGEPPEAPRVDLAAAAQALKPTAAPGQRWTIDQLYDTTFPDPKWVIPGIIPEGLIFLGGRPKVGKSLLALQIACGLATGGRLFDKPITQGRVLYLALEDTPRRIRERAQKMRIPRGATIDFETTWRPLHQGGLDDLTGEVIGGQYDLIIIDTLTRAAPGVDQMDAKIIGPVIDQLQRLAVNHNITIIILDHTRKPNGQFTDPIDDLMASTAKSGAADAILAIYKEQGKRGATLKGRGRDIDEIDLALTLDPLTLCWQSNGDSGEFTLTVRRKELLEALKQTGKATAPTIQKIAGGDRSNIYKELNDLVSAGKAKTENIGGKVYYDLM